MASASQPAEVWPIQFSICIPTYNRSALLEQALSALLDQWHTDLSPSQRCLVEIAVSDNCSPDDTSAVVQRAAVAYPGLCLTYFRQRENRGGDANILHAMQMGRGEFVYLLSDDDLLLPGALAKLFSLLETYPEADGFFLNTRSFVQDIREKTLPNFPLTEDLQIVGKDASLLLFGTWITFISALAFRRTRIAGKQYEERVGTFLVQSYFYLDLLAEARFIVATHEPFLAVRDNNTGGYNFFEIFVTHFADLMRHAQVLGYSKAATRQVLNRHLKSFVTPFIATFKLNGAYGSLQPDFRDGVRRLLAEYGASPFLIFGLLPLVSLPRGLVRGLQTVVRFLKKRPAAAAEAGKVT
jgi:glycosyltransferase involved in cell wall biosynthesis